MSWLLVPIACFLLAGAARAEAGWRPPVRGEVAGDYAYSARTPFRAGQRRGVDFAARRGEVVTAVCTGSVTYAGPVPARGLGVTVRCGRLVTTHLGLGRLLVGRGARVRIGSPIATAGATGAVRLGARVAGRPFEYVDPLALIEAERRPLGPAPPPRASRPRTRPRPVPRHQPPSSPAIPARVPLAAWAGLALLAFALPAGGLASRRRRRCKRVTPRPGSERARTPATP